MRDCLLSREINLIGFVMKFELWLTFAAAYTVVSLIPGPSVFMVTAQALRCGLKPALLCVVGDLLGGIVLMTLSLVGVGAILAASATLFQIFKWLGVLYMAYLGACMIMEARRDPDTDVPNLSAATGAASLKIGFLTGVLNPKAIIFYMAFLSQFMDPAGNQLLQFSILMVTSSIVVGVVLSGYALAAARARQVFQSRVARRRFNYTGGGFMLGSSVLMATTR